MPSRMPVSLVLANGWRGNGPAGFARGAAPGFFLAGRSSLSLGWNADFPNARVTTGVFRRPEADAIAFCRVS
jgi:hypothetical protein